MNNRKNILFPKLQINDKKFNDEEIVKDKKTNNIIIELSHKHEKLKIVISISEWREINLYLNDKIANFAQKVNNNIKEYETFNVLSETGDSIFSPTIEELITVVTKGKGQVFISENKLEEFVNKIID